MDKSSHMFRTLSVEDVFIRLEPNPQGLTDPEAAWRNTAPTNERPRNLSRHEPSLPRRLRICSSLSFRQEPRFLPFWGTRWKRLEKPTLGKFIYSRWV